MKKKEEKEKGKKRLKRKKIEAKKQKHKEIIKQKGNHDCKKKAMGSHFLNKSPSLLIGKGELFFLFSGGLGFLHFKVDGCSPIKLRRKNLVWG